LANLRFDIYCNGLKSVVTICAEATPLEVSHTIFVISPLFIILAITYLRHLQVIILHSANFAELR